MSDKYENEADIAVDPLSLNRLYGRSKGKKLREGQQYLLDNLLPQISVPEQGDINSKILFGDERPLHFEIGFGGGEHMAYRANMLPDHGFIGCEPFINGVAQLLPQIENYDNMGPLANIRLHMGDALSVLKRLPDESLSFAYLLHPDPWPKARHAKRRMMNDGPVGLIHQKLKAGGEFRFGTDHPIYVRHALMVMQRNRDKFIWLNNGPQDFQNRPSGWPQTRYEAKARRLGHEIWYFRYQKPA
ncbi:tRNA (guanosine(46)-N7)-methyltransferase TrmB [Sphingorhabdus lutea]|uniref:tRNA (guanine-N(7)-)-methyltransferase n=1 Tax=Sphingorhabdus lutea TaxID=1913578 RepID=A0A1L3JEM7_9SPHN|nr:tRNA (guanine(46)-N(7))-methyltransferase TrmB [Sphingorhabdus lutea]APG63574.1 tRNA (guanosine(46)-N7)-methyltransferase TrmB [Sphingorhabdus lutea]